MSSDYTARCILLFIRGIPGSGKSYVASGLREKLPNVTVLDPDMIHENDKEFIEYSHQLRAEGVDVKIHQFRWLRQKAIESVAPASIIIWNQPFTDIGILQRLISYIRKTAETEKAVDVHVAIVEMDTPVDIAWQRVSQRKKNGGHGPNKDTFTHRVESYAPLDTDHKILTINGTDPLDVSIERIVQLITTLQSS